MLSQNFGISRLVHGRISVSYRQQIVLEPEPLIGLLSAVGWVVHIYCWVPHEKFPNPLRPDPRLHDGQELVHGTEVALALREVDGSAQTDGGIGILQLFD